MNTVTRTPDNEIEARAAEGEPRWDACPEWCSGSPIGAHEPDTLTQSGEMVMDHYKTLTLSPEMTVTRTLTQTLTDHGVVSEESYAVHVEWAILATAADARSYAELFLGLAGDMDAGERE